MTELNIHEAKTHLSRYLMKVREGETILLCKNGTPVAEIVPLSKAHRPRRRLFGLAKGLVRIPDSFFDPLTNDEFPGIGL